VSLKLKFDKLAAKKKSTGDPDCPPDVRRAKNIARDILATAQAAVLGDYDDDDDDAEDAPEQTSEANHAGGGAGDEDGGGSDGGTNGEGGGEASTGLSPAVAGGRGRKRAHGAAGITLTRKEDPLVESVRTVAQKMCDLTDAYVRSDAEDMQKVVKEEVDKVRKEVDKVAKETKASIESLKTFIKEILQ